MAGHADTLRINALGRRRQALAEEHAAVEAQLEATIDDGLRVRLSRRADRLLDEIGQIDAQLRALGADTAPERTAPQPPAELHLWLRRQAAGSHEVQLTFKAPGGPVEQPFADAPPPIISVDQTALLAVMNDHQAYGRALGAMLLSD
ncbi:MAG: hypothetical protein HGA45_33775, partial [Chloroflexales bacterium]|nr:hypothetical protein [Chloroflexales bacterium]